MDTKIKASFWDDDAVGRLAEAKDHAAIVALLWLMTARINNAGWVEYSSRLFSFQTGADHMAITRACDALGLGMVTHEKGIWIRSYIRHQIGTGAALSKNTMSGAVISSFSHIPQDVVKLILAQYPELKLSPSYGDRMSIPSTREEKRREEKRRARAGSSLVFPDHWPADKRAIVEEWLAYKAEKGQRYKPRGFGILLSKLEGLTAERLREVVDSSMVANYAGLFPDKPCPTPPGSFFGKKREVAAAAPAPNPYEVPPCAGWKQIARSIAQRLGVDEGEIEEMDWKQLPAEARLAVWGELKKERVDA